MSLNEPVDGEALAPCAPTAVALWRERLRLLATIAMMFEVTLFVLGLEQQSQVFAMLQGSLIVLAGAVYVWSLTCNRLRLLQLAAGVLVLPALVIRGPLAAVYEHSPFGSVALPLVVATAALITLPVGLPENLLITAGGMAAAIGGLLLGHVKTSFNPPLAVAAGAAMLLAGMVKAVINERRRQAEMISIGNEQGLKTLRERSYSVLVHDMKSPIMALNGFIDLLLLGSQGPLTKEQRESLEVMRGSARQMQSYMEHSLAGMRLASMSDAEAEEHSNLWDILEELLERFKPRLQEGDLELDLSRLPPPGDALRALRVRGAHGIVAAVVENILTNAIKYADSKIGIVLHRENSNLRLAISDDGRPIPEEQVPRIFEPFVQLAGGKQGSGLGLYSVKRSLSRLGGNVTVEKTPGFTKAFVIRLPLSAPPKRARTGVHFPPLTPKSEQQ